MAVDTKDDRTPEQRLRLIEDRFEIYNLIASHPPSADTGAGDYTASVWTEDDVFDRGAEFARPTGRAAIAGGSSNPCATCAAQNSKSPGPTAVTLSSTRYRPVPAVTKYNSSRCAEPAGCSSVVRRIAPPVRRQRTPRSIAPGSAARRERRSATQAAASHP